MPATAARLGYGSVVEISTDAGSSWTEVEEVTNLTPPSFAIDTVDATHMQSPNRTREYIPGINDGGETSFTINWIPGSDAEVMIRGLATGFTAIMIRETFPNGVTWTVSGILTGYTPAVPLDDKMTADITIKVTGAVTAGAAVAPTNTTLPGIAGTAQVGETLFAFPGVWSGAPAFTFQWNNEGVPINGATSQSYTLQASDEGDAITVTVTGTNSAGNASATSEATIDVIAA